MARLAFLGLVLLPALPAIALTEAGASMPSVPEALEQAGKATAEAAGKVEKIIQSDPWTWGHVIAAGVVVLALLMADVIRPGSFERAGKRNVDPHSTILWFCCAVLVLGAQFVGGAFVQFVPAQYLGAAGSLQHSAVGMGVQYLVAVAVGLLLCKLIHSGAKDAGMAFSAKTLAWGTMAGLLAWPVVIASSVGFVVLHKQIHNVESVSTIAHPTLDLLVKNRENVWAWSLAGLAIFAAPVVEEIVYRGFVQSGLLKLFGRPWLAIILASLAFMGVHMIPMALTSGQDGQSGLASMPWYSAATVGVLGLCMGVAYERTKEIGVPILMHMIFNLINVLLAAFAAG